VGWLEFMEEGSIAGDKALLGESRELCAILTESLTTARASFQIPLTPRAT